MTDFDASLLTLLKPGREYTANDITARAKRMLKLRVPQDEAMTSMSRLMAAGLITSDRVEGVTAYRIADMKRRAGK